MRWQFRFIVLRCAADYAGIGVTLQAFALLGASQKEPQRVKDFEVQFGALAFWGRGILMKSELNCICHLDESHDYPQEGTQAYIKKEHRKLDQDYPDIAQAELHLRGFAQRSGAHLWMQDKNQIVIEARAHSDDLDVAVSIAFQRAKSY